MRISGRCHESCPPISIGLIILATRQGGDFSLFVLVDQGSGLLYISGLLVAALLVAAMTGGRDRDPKVTVQGRRAETADREGKYDLPE